MSDPVEVHRIAGVAYVLPLYEGRPHFATRIGAFGIGFTVRLSAFGVGFELLKAGVIFTLGPAYFWIAHIERQSAAFDAIDAPPTVPQP